MRFASVCLGGTFGSATDYKGRVFVWGTNSSGEMGLGGSEAKI